MLYVEELPPQGLLPPCGFNTTVSTQCMLRVTVSSHILCYNCCVWAQQIFFISFHYWYRLWIFVETLCSLKSLCIQNRQVHRQQYSVLLNPSVCWLGCRMSVSVCPCPWTSACLQSSSRSCSWRVKTHRSANLSVACPDALHWLVLSVTTQCAASLCDISQTHVDVTY